MPTSEEAQAWLEAMFGEGDTLAHHGILGMKWGHRMAAAPASGVSSHQVDKQAQKDARDHAALAFEVAHETKNTQLKTAQNHLDAQNKRIESKMAANSEYAKAFNYHSPKEHARVSRNNKIATGVVVGAAGAYVVYRGGKLVKAFSPEFMHMAYTAGSKVAARRGAGSAANILKQIGPARTAAMVKGADGIFRLATAVA